MHKLLIITILTATCINAIAQKITRQGYVNLYKQWAITEMNRVGIPASITLAQGILESECGNSRLAIEGNNHFGIKCHSDWTGESIYHDDDRNHECFRKYTSAYDSFKDHSDFLREKSRYSNLFKLDHTDYKSWAYGLKAAGYATDPQYAQKLITIIEEMGLEAYDTGQTPATADDANHYTYDINNGYVAENDTEKPKLRVKKNALYSINPLHEHTVDYNNGVKYITVMNGDTFVSIAKEFHLLVSELLAYNDLDATADINQIKYLYIRAKKNRAHPSCSTHTVQKGETVWSISHKYGIKLRKLRRFNRLSTFDTVTEGQVLNLRSSK